MPEPRRSPRRSSLGDAGPMIAVILAGVLLFVVVALGGSSADNPARASNATTAAPWTNGGWVQVESAIVHVETRAASEA